MRVLTITNLYPPHGYGGYELSCADTMNHFAASGHEVLVLTSTARIPGVAVGPEPRVLRTLHPFWDWEKQQFIPHTDMERLRAEWESQRAVKQAIARFRPDVVSVWHMGGLGLALLSEVESRGLPMVVVVGDDWPVYLPRVDAWTDDAVELALPRRLARILRLQTRRPDFHWAVFAFNSDRTRHVAETRGRWPGARSVVAYPGVDLGDFPVTRRSPDSWSWRILYVGRVEPEKGILTLLRAFARLPATAQLTCIGRGGVEYRRRITSAASALGVAGRVAFSAADRASLRDRYLEADVLVFPPEWEEPFGIVPLEAMACGTPVVATGTGGSAEYLRDDVNCLLFPRGDVGALVERLERLAADPTLRLRLSEAGAITASTFSAERYEDQLLTLHLQTKG